MMFTHFQPKIAIVGLGYVGLPLAHAFVQQGYEVLGYDINEQRLGELRDGQDSTGEIQGDDLQDLNKIAFSSDPLLLSEYNFIIVTVPTPIDQFKNPDLTPVIKATETVAKYLQAGSIVVYESTVYPGVTEEICLPIIEEVSGLEYGGMFKLGYSPERINPGDKEHTVTNITKVVSGSDAEALRIISDVYGSIIRAGVFEASSIKVAEASKVIENTQRDTNIALMNELSLIFNKIGINTMDVLEAAGTKWNFLPFHPGLVGGHCIGVDPYYLIQKAEHSKHYPEIIKASRKTNDMMGMHVAQQTIKLLIQAGHQVKGAKVLILGLAFKENVPDFRNTRVGDVIQELQEFGVDVRVYDPYQEALNNHIISEIGINESQLVEDLTDKWDGIVYAVDHKEFTDLDLPEMLVDEGVVFDVKGRWKDEGLKWWRGL